MAGEMNASADDHIIPGFEKIIIIYREAVDLTSLRKREAGAGQLQESITPTSTASRCWAA
jgi:hypothetical protein